MENRDKDKMSQRDSSTQSGNINRDVSQKQSGSSADFGQKIGQSEKLNEPSSRTSGSVGSSGLKSGSSSDLDSSDITSDKDKSSESWSDKSSRH